MNIKTWDSWLKCWNYLANKVHFSYNQRHPWHNMTKCHLRNIMGQLFHLKLVFYNCFKLCFLCLKHSLKQFSSAFSCMKRTNWHKQRLILLTLSVINNTWKCAQQANVHIFYFSSITGMRGRQRMRERSREAGRPCCNIWEPMLKQCTTPPSAPLADWWVNS